MFDISTIDKNWTLFLDRDGVINHEIQGTYVRNWGEFIFYPRATENIRYFNERFQRIFLATNQRAWPQLRVEVERSATLRAEAFRPSWYTLA